MPDKQSQINELRATLSKMEIALGKVEECIVWTDITGRIKWCNEAFNHFLSQPKLLILGQFLSAKLPLSLNGVAIAPEEHPVNLALHTKQQDKQNYEFITNGNVRILEVTWAFVAIKTKSTTNLNSEMEESSAVIVLRDITQQCEFEKQLQASNEILEQLVIQRTQELQQVNLKLELEAQQLQLLVDELKRTQAHLVQSEKMSALGQLVAGIAHEINNPINFIHGNIFHLEESTKTLLTMLQLYQVYYPDPNTEIKEAAEELELEFVQKDTPKLLNSMKLGTNRIREIVLSLRNFSRMDEADCKVVDLHEGIESTLLILQHRLREKENQFKIQINRDYGEITKVECYPGQLNQVLMNILVNAIDVIQENCAEKTNQKQGEILVSTKMLNEDWVEIKIADNGSGMDEMVQKQIFDPFFTTKPIGKGTGMGMAISYQIITEKHRGHLSCSSILGQGTEFTIQIPTKQELR